MIADLEQKVNAIDVGSLEAELDTQGWSIVPAFLSPAQCQHARSLYEDSALFRKRVVMGNHGYGKGEYQYFDYPLPPLVETLRHALYPPLVPLANRWSAALGDAGDFPPTHAEFIARCRTAGQARPTPLLLKYVPGDYNRLHQDLYGEHVFPLQVACLLSAPGHDFTGGEFVMTEQRARMQSRPMVVPLGQGDLLVFAVRSYPVTGAQRLVRAALRHGVSEIHSGTRTTLGIIFHDAE